MSRIRGTIMAQSAVTRWYSVCALNFNKGIPPGWVLPCFNEVTSRWQRAVISLPTTLRLVRSANKPTLSNRKK